MTARLKVRIVDGRATWDCPEPGCNHKDFPPPAHRLAWVIDRGLYHLRWKHGITATTPPPTPAPRTQALAGDTNRPALAA